MEQTIKIGGATIVVTLNGEVKASAPLSFEKTLTKEQQNELGQIIATFIYEMEIE